MGNWQKQMETMKEKKDKDKNSKDVLGKFFFDLAKLVFTAMVLVAAVSLIIITDALIFKINLVL